MLDHIFGETTVVGDSLSAKLDYNYKTDFEIWKENKEFKRQNVSMSQPPLGATHVGTNASNAKILTLDSTPVGTKTPDPKTQTLTT